MIRINSRLYSKNVCRYISSHAQSAYKPIKGAQEAFESKLSYMKDERMMKYQPSIDYMKEFSPEEKNLRVDLAAAYRLTNLYGWDDVIYNHITVRLPHDSKKEKFLINPYGLGYDEITASSLVTVDVDGNVIHPGYPAGEGLEASVGRINAAGYLIHSAVHAARDDAHCILHSHHPDIVAVSSTPGGLHPVGQAYYALGDIAYHDYEGLALLEGEKKTLARDIGSRAKVVLLKNHGCLTMGTTVAEAWTKLYFLVMACSMQNKALAASSKPVFPSKEIQAMSTEQALSFNKEGFGSLEFAYLKRRLDRLIGEGYKR